MMPVLCATWSKATCFSCSHWLRWSRRRISMPPKCATRRSRCYARYGRSTNQPPQRTASSANMLQAWFAAESVPGYVDELGGPSGTETFVALKAHVDNWRWRGVPFYLRTGKRLPTASRRSSSSCATCPIRYSRARGALAKPNKLIIRLQPEENIRLLVMAKEPGLDRDGIRLREVPLDLSLASAFAGARRRIAYERLLLDFIEGDPTLFVRRDEIEAQWEWIDCDPRWLGVRSDSTPNPMPPARGARRCGRPDQARRSELA